MDVENGILYIRCGERQGVDWEWRMAFGAWTVETEDDDEMHGEWRMAYGQ